MANRTSSSTRSGHNFPRLFSVLLLFFALSVSEEWRQYAGIGTSLHIFENGWH